MKEQTYKTHRRWVKGYHMITFIAILGMIAGAIRNLVYTEDESLYNSLLLVIGSFVLLLLFYYSRSFSLKAQDRAIRAEENFRHYILTGKQLPDGLTMRQIVGLRFASDEEFPGLAEKAVSENLSEGAIKKSIKNWKSDHYRV